MKGLLILLWLLLCFEISTGAFAKTYDINTYGAEADGKTLCTAAIQKAIYACTSGDTVLVPAGRYVTGTIHLKSNITIYLEKESVLIGSTNINHYEPYTISGGIKNYYGILYTNGATNVSIAGPGVIDGSNQAFFQLNKNQQLDTAFTKYTRQQANYHKPLYTTVSTSATLISRPQSVMLFTARTNVSVVNASILNAPGVALHFIACEGIRMSNVKIESDLKAIDASGILIEGCKKVTLKGSNLRSGGNAIAIGGFKRDLAQTVNSSQSILVTDCALQSSLSAICISSLDESSVAEMQVSHINIMPSGRGIGLIVRGTGSLENISFNDIYIETKLGYGNWEVNGEPIHISAVPGVDAVKLGAVRNVTFNNLLCNGENQVLIYGSAQSAIQNVQFNDVVLNLKNSEYKESAGGNMVLAHHADKKRLLFTSNIPAVMARYVNGLSLNNLKINWLDNTMAPYFTAGIEISHFKDIRLNRCDVKPVATNFNAHAISLIDGSLAVVDAGDVSRIRVQDAKPAKGTLRLAGRKAGLK